MSFREIDDTKFPCFRLAVNAGKRGGTAPAILSAANEIAVERFLNHEISFMDIPKLLKKVMDVADKESVIVQDPALSDVINADTWGRRQAKLIAN